MTNEERIAKLETEVSILSQLFAKDKYSNLEIFRRQVQFKAGVDFENINTITKTADTAVIADGNHTVSIPDGGGDITITTKNGIITSIT